MPSSTFAPSSKPLSGRYLTFAEREEIALDRAQGFGVREIARRLGRAASTVSRELRRNAATRSGGLEYRASTAQWHAERSARRPKRAKLAINAALRAYVQDRLAGQVVAQDGAAVGGPIVPWKGRRHGPRQKRRWGMAWSPEQIARRLRHDFPGDETMQISHEAIYQALYVQGRGALRRELSACLRTGSSAPRSSGARTRSGQILHWPRGDDQRTPRGSGRPGSAGALGGRPYSRAPKFGDRNPRGAHDAVHDAAAPASHGWPRSWRSRQERPGTRRPRCRGGTRRHHAHDHDPA